MMMKRLLVTFIFFVTFLATVCSKIIDVFADLSISQQKFAAEEIKEAFQSKGQDVNILDIRDLETSNPNQRVVLGLFSNGLVRGMYEIEGDKVLDQLGEQSFSIHTTTGESKTYWVFGGGINGTMYGGLQLAEYINLYGLDHSFNEVQSPDILKRGIKYNIPFDKRSPTYYGSGFSENDFRGVAAKKAIPHIWDLDFWQEMFDELARHRYNAISLWSLHPFTSMIKLDEYPEVAIQNIEGFDGFYKKMTIDEKIKFWKEVMAIAKNRGFDFYMYNWNIYTYGATGKYGIDNDPENPKTIEYMRKCMTKLFETYPDLTGFGITAGENMVPLTNAEEADWTWATYGQGTLDYAQTHPEREVVFIHRYHDAGGAEVAANFKPLIDLPNVQFDFSFKYAVAHIYSTTTPEWILTRNGDVPAQLLELDLKTWIELRNDSFYYIHWGDPAFVKEYLASFPEKERTVRGFFMGSDGYTPTYTFTSKADWPQGKLDMRRTWYTWMLWGRLAYNPELSDEFFQRIIGNRYPEITSETLFNAWSEASKCIPLFTEVIQGTLISDFKWYPETCMSRPNGFVTIEQIADAIPPPGSKVCSIAESASNSCGNRKSTYLVADEIEMHAEKALKAINKANIPLDSELGTNLGNIRAMSYLGLYFAEKLRGATSKEANKLEEAKEALRKAYHYWLKYSTLMDEMYLGQDLQRTRPVTNWSDLDAEVLNEYIRLGGSVDTIGTMKNDKND